MYIILLRNRGAAVTLGALLVAASLAAQQKPQIYYYCSTPTQLYVWNANDPSDQAPIEVRRRQDNSWAAPSGFSDSWRSILTQIPDPKARNWNDLGAKLCSDHPSGPWAEPRYPDLELYVRKYDDEHLDLVVLATGRLALYPFTKTGTLWTKKGDLPLGELMRLGGDKEAEAVLLPDFDGPFAQFCDQWLNSLLNLEEPRRHMAYYVAGGKPAWVWMEALDGPGWIERFRRPMPPGPPTVQTKEVKIYRLSKAQALGFSLAGAGVWIPFFLYKWRRWSFRWPKFRLPWFGHVARPAAPKFKKIDRGELPEISESAMQQLEHIDGRLEDRLGHLYESIEQLLDHRLQNLVSNTADPRQNEFRDLLDGIARIVDERVVRFASNETEQQKQESRLVNSIARVLDGRIATLTAQRATQQQEQSRSILENIGLALDERLARLASKETDQQKEDAKLAAAARDCHGVLLEAKESIVLPGETAERWLKDLPQRLRTAILGSRQAESGLRQELDKRAKAAQTDKTQAEQTISDLRRSLESEKAKVREAEQKSVVLGARAETLEKVQDLIPVLRMGQTNLLDDSRDTPSSAIVGFLLSYSLLHLSLSSGQNDLLQKSMLANITLISRRLAEQKLFGFQRTVDKLESQSWNVDALPQSASRSGDDDRDGRIFQVILKYLRDQRRLDLSPFYFGVDGEGHAYQAN